MAKCEDYLGDVFCFPSFFYVEDLFIYLFKDFIYFFLERGEEKEKERERNINVWLSLTCPQLGTWPATQACALTGNPLICRPTVLNPLSYTRQGNLFIFLKYFIYLFLERGEGREEKHRCGDISISCLLHAPSWGPGLQPRPVPFRFAGRHSVHQATPARAYVGDLELCHFWEDCGLGINRRSINVKEEKSKLRSLGPSRKGLLLGIEGYMAHLIAPARFKIVGGFQ